MRNQVENDSALAGRLAAETGALLLHLRDCASPDSDIRSTGDRAAHSLLTTRLGELRPDDAVLSEEAADNPDRLSAGRVWLIDPLDGTREFGEGRDDWAVHVALWNCGRLAAGAVALPSLRITLTTESPPAVPPRFDGQLRVAVSRSRPDAEMLTALDRLGAQVLPMGSAGFKVSTVIHGNADAYVHAGGQYEWDSAAPVAVARAAGLHTSRIDGSELTYNAPDPYLPDLIVCRTEIVDQLLSALTSVKVIGAAR